MKYKNLLVILIITLAIGCGAADKKEPVYIRNEDDTYTRETARNSDLSGQEDTAYENILFGMSPAQYQQARGEKVVTIGKMLYMKSALFDDKYGLYQFVLVSPPAPLSEEESIIEDLVHMAEVIETKYGTADTMFEPTLERTQLSYCLFYKWVIGNKTIEIARYRDDSDQSMYGMCTIERVDLGRLHENNKAAAAKENLSEEGRKF